MNREEPVEEEPLYPRIPKEEVSRFVEDVREHLVWERVRREQAAKRRRAEEAEDPEKPSNDSSEERVRAHLTEVREAFAAEDAYRNKLKRERLARKRRSAQEEEGEAEPGD